MSFFPTADLERLHSSTAINHQVFQTSPTAPCNELLRDESQVNNIDGPGPPPVHESTTWLYDQHHLTSPTQFSTSRDITVYASVHPFQSYSLSASWPPQSPLFCLPGAPVERSRADSFDLSNSTLSTPVPNVQRCHFTYGLTPASVAHFDASPIQSDYSATSGISDGSSPYTQSDSNLHYHRPPEGKQEDGWEYAASSTPWPCMAAPHENQNGIHPDYLMRKPLQVNERFPAIAPRPAPQLGSSTVDVKSVVRSKRPGFRRSKTSTGIGAQEQRRRRGFTTPENANCRCDQCGKLFQRTYNLKAHLATHNPNRRQPHICHESDCDKRFVRGTDLLRHQRSVHQNAKDFECPLCRRSFARKDTLKRHVDDGCPKRSEVRKRTTKGHRASIEAQRQPSSPLAKTKVPILPTIEPAT